ncbi:hypothetical protein R1sor_008428 [Riccia sorocarpa]|uniref:Timeless N-terminal domain-containing protein n=1 Tax=Riccia sorocarpa TaxID=122646 RepID=A0ABD3HW77_9MARC
MDEEGLAIVCSTLGAFQQNGSSQEVYVKHDECLESLKDLQRYLRRDHPENRDVFMQLGKWNIVRRDIVPLITRYSGEHELALNCVKVLVFLTMPIDPASTQVSLQVEYLQHFRAALLDNSETIPVVMSLLEDSLQHLERGAAKDEDWKLIQLFLTLLRNLLAIPDTFTHHISASTQYAFLKDKLLEVFFQKSVMELVVALTKHTAGRHGGLRHDKFLLLEILHHVLAGKRPDIVAAASDKHFKAQKKSEKVSATLRALMHEERAQLKNSRYDPALHTPFSGMFVRVAQDGTKTILTRTPHQSPLEDVLRKPQIRRGPIKRVVAENAAVQPTSDHLQVLLKEFVNQLLASGYNILMQGIKDDLRRDRTSSEERDPVPFFQVVQFITAYVCRTAQRDQETYKQSASSSGAGESEVPAQKQICGSIASTLDEDMFVLVRTKWCYFIDEAQTSKNWIPVGACIAVMKDMIHMMDVILKRPGPVDEEAALELRTARILLYKVFYDQTETGIIQTVISLLKSFDIHKQPRSFLADLVEITHIVIRMLEAATKEGTLKVLKKVRGSRKKPKAPSDKPDENTAVENHVNTETNEANDQNDPSKVPSSELGEEPAETDLITTNEEETEQAVIKEQTDNSTLGNTENWAESTGEQGQKETAPTNNEDDYDDDDDDEPEALTKEVSLDIHELVVRRFADNTVVRNYCWLLKYYSSNSAATNYYIVRMLQRICEDRILEPMLYQLSIFQIFYAILSDKQLCASKDHKFVVSFLTKVVRGYFKRLKTQPMLFIDILFWKQKYECANIAADYMIHNLRRAAGVGGGEGSSQAVRQRVNIADALGDDDDPAPPSRRDEDEDELGSDSAGSDASDDDDNAELPSSPRANLLSESQEEQLKELYQKYKGGKECIEKILEELDPSRGITAKQVKRKLRQLGLLGRHDGKARRRPSKLGTDETRKLKKRSAREGDRAESSKRKKSNLFSESQDAQLKELFQKHGDSTKCTRLITESFGGLYTTGQVSRRLRTLGLVRQKAKSKLQKFLANIGEDDDSGSQDENGGELRSRNRAPSLKGASRIDLSDDSDRVDDGSDDNATLGSMLGSNAFPNPGDRAEEEPNNGPSSLALRAIIGRGARRKSSVSHGEGSEAGVIGNGSNSAADADVEEVLTGRASEEDVHDDRSSEDLPISEAQTAGRRRSGGDSAEVPATPDLASSGKHVDRSGEGEQESVSFRTQNTTGGAFSPEFEDAGQEEPSEGKFAKRRRLARKVLTSPASEDESQIAGNLLPTGELGNQEQSITEELADELNDF